MWRTERQGHLGVVIGRKDDSGPALLKIHGGSGGAEKGGEKRCSGALQLRRGAGSLNSVTRSIAWIESVIWSL